MLHIGLVSLTCSLQHVLAVFTDVTAFKLAAAWSCLNATRLTGRVLMASVSPAGLDRTARTKVREQNADVGKQ